MVRRIVGVVFLVGVIGFMFGGRVAAQRPNPPGSTVKGSGTPGTIPVWTGTGTTLTDSHIQDDGTDVSVNLPVHVFVGGAETAIQANSQSGPFGVFGTAGSSANGTTGVGGEASAQSGITFGVQGFAHSPDGVGIQGNNYAGGTGVSGFSLEGSNGQGVAGFGSFTGVTGVGSAETSWGVKGFTDGVNGVGVEGFSGNVGVRGQSLECDENGCTSKDGVAGQFVAGAGGTLLQGFLGNFDGQGNWDEKFSVDAAGNLSIEGNAFKPGGGSWSTLSDRRTKQNITAISDPLQRLLRLSGVNFEYLNPAAFAEKPGVHLGMVAQDVEAVFPSWIDTGSDGYKRLTFRGFEALVVEAVRELDNRSRVEAEDARARIETLLKQNADLLKQVEALKEAVRSLHQSQ